LEDTIAYKDVTHLKDHCVYELILGLFGYRLVEWYLQAKQAEEKKFHLDTLAQIYQLKEIKMTECYGESVAEINGPTKF